MDNEKNNIRNNSSERNSGKTAGSNFFDSLLNDIQKADDKIKDSVEQPSEREAARAAAEKARAEEAARAAAEKARAEEAARAAAEKAARAAAEQASAEEAARQAAIEKAQKEAKERLAQIEAEKKAAKLAAKEEKARLAALEKARAVEAARQAALEKAKAEEVARQAALEEAARKAAKEEPEYAALNFTDPTAAASAAIAMKLAGTGEESEDHNTIIADEEFEQSSYRSLTGEEKARQAAIEKARAKEAERVAALEQAKAEEAARAAAFEKEAAEQKAVQSTDAAADRTASEGSATAKPAAKTGSYPAGAKPAASATRPAATTAEPAKPAAASTADTAKGEKPTAAAKTTAKGEKPTAAAKTTAAKPATASSAGAAKSAKAARPAAANSADAAKAARPAASNTAVSAKGGKPAAANTADAAKAGRSGAPDNKPVKPAKPKRDRSPGKIISIVHLVLSVLTVLLLLIANVLPIPLLLIVTAGLAAIWFLTRLFRTQNAGRFRRLLGSALSIFMCFVLVLSSAMLLRLNVTLQSITGINSQIATFGVYALVEDSAETIKDVKDDTFGVLETQSRAMTDDAIGQINKEVGKSINTANYADGSALANALMNGECRTIIMNENFMDVITDTDGYGNFESKTKEIASYTCTSILESRLSKSHSPDVITMYITGIDTFGDISTTSRSDVNIIAVANTKTRQVLLVSTPRDYYVPLSISNGIPDKLTHAGIYGVNVSMDTLGMLYDIDMDYYFRINFDGFKEVIDALDGVTVWSDNEFDAGGNHYVQGYNTMNGEQALAFARERHSFASGDRQRGKNQMAVIQAVIQKLQTPAILNNYNDLLKGLEGSFETDLPSTRITGLVKQQLAKPGSWNVVQYSVDGTGDMNTTYSMNQRLYVMIPDQSTVDTAKRMIEMVDNGAVITSQQ